MQEQTQIVGNRVEIEFISHGKVRKSFGSGCLTHFNANSFKASILLHYGNDLVELVPQTGLARFHAHMRW